MTAKHLNQTGNVTAHVCDRSEADLRGFDIVHGFGLSRAQVRTARRARSAGSHLADLLAEGLRPWRDQPRSRLGEAAYRLACDGSPRRRRDQRAAPQQGRGLSSVGLSRPRRRTRVPTCCFPIRPRKPRLSSDELGVTTPQHVVPNAVDPAEFAQMTTQARSGVLMVARFEPFKNQLGLIRALRSSEYRLTLVGDAHPEHGSYYARCLKEGAGRVTFRSGIRHGPELARLYAAAKVHVLPSYFETTGLVSLEAGVAGCNVVTTSRGFARDYFQDLAWYCDPDDLASIRSAVAEAYAAPRIPGCGKGSSRTTRGRGPRRRPLPHIERCLSVLPEPRPPSGDYDPVRRLTAGTAAHRRCGRFP